MRAIDTATDTEIFVFGSNLQGRHGKGAGRHALEHRGAVRAPTLYRR